VPGFLATVAGVMRRDTACAMRGHHRQLDLSVGRPGPHDFAVRENAVRRSAFSRPSHPAFNVRDDREAPLFRARDGVTIVLIWAFHQAIYFRRQDWTTQISLKRLGKLTVWRARHSGAARKG